MGQRPGLATRQSPVFSSTYEVGDLRGSVGSDHSRVRVSVSTRRGCFSFNAQTCNNAVIASFSEGLECRVRHPQDREMFGPTDLLKQRRPSSRRVQRTGMMAPVNRSGRRSKGDRKFVGFRIATPKADAMDLVAKAEGYQYVSDWLSDLVDERLANTNLHAIVQQEELPLGRLAS